jgi:hypothetical protein
MKKSVKKKIIKYLNKMIQDIENDKIYILENSIKFEETADVVDIPQHNGVMLLRCFGTFCVNLQYSYFKRNKI